MKKKHTPDRFDVFLSDYPIIKELYSEAELEEFLKAHGKAQNFHDALWLLFNQAITKDIDFLTQGREEEYFQNCARVYFAMKKFRYWEGADAKTFNKYLRLAFESEVNGYMAREAESTVQWRVKVIPGPECEYAKSIAHIEYKTDEFFSSCHIATDRCNDRLGFCRCATAKVGARYRHGRILRK